jgi:pyruvate dehydrogenase phosphatase
MEDRHAEDTVSKSMILPSGDQIEEKIRLFSIFDGHGGTATSQLLTKTLHPMIILSLRSLYAGHYPTLPLQPNRSASSHILSYISSLTSPITSLLTPTVQITPGTISSSLQSAFLTLDDQIISAPLRLIPHFPAKPGKPSVRPIIIPMVEPAVSGSCAITLMVDEEREELLVASTGDCRAVAGYWVEGEGWRCEVLTDDHMAKNPKEVQRWVGPVGEQIGINRQMLLETDSDVRT